VQIVDNSASGSSSSTLGSGFVYDDNGHIATNNHVVSAAGTLDVTFLDGTIYRAKVIGSDPYSDLAVLYVSGVPKYKLVPLPLADSTKLRIGEAVAAVGNPFGLSGSMTSGIVSGLGRLIPDQQAGQFAIPDVVQTDAAVNPGNSGGPLLDMRAGVFCINSAIYTSTGQFSGIGFAVPSDTIGKVIPALITQGSYSHPWLGVSGRDMTPGIADALGLKEPRGFLVVDTIKGSPADQAGIRGGTRDAVIDGSHIKLGGDVIVQVDGKDVRKIDDILVYLQREKSVGDTLKLTVLRDGSSTEIDAILGSRPALPESP
jgi:S1-C subfamily serine protease